MPSRTLPSGLHRSEEALDGLLERVERGVDDDDEVVENRITRLPIELSSEEMSTNRFDRRLEVARASKLLGAEAFGHLACELRDVTLLGCLDEDSLHAERLQLGRSRLAAFRIPLDPRHVATLCCLTPAADGSSDMAAVWASV